MSSRSHNIPVTGNVQYDRAILPSPPVSPPPSLYPQQLIRTTIYGPPPSSMPSVGKPSAPATEVPAATMSSSSLYGEPRYPANRSSEKPLFMNVSTSSAMKHTEVCISVVASHSCLRLDDTQFRMMSWACLCLSILHLILSFCLTTLPITHTSFLQNSHKPTNGFSAMGNSLSSNQVSFSHRNSVVPQEHRCICAVKRASHVFCASHILNHRRQRMISNDCKAYQLHRTKEPPWPRT